MVIIIFQNIFYHFTILNFINYNMPANKRPRRLNYAVNKKRTVAWGKVGKTISHYQKLLKRVAFEGETKWLKNALAVATAKLNKYKINLNKI